MMAFASSIRCGEANQKYEGVEALSVGGNGGNGASYEGGALADGFWETELSEGSLMGWTVDTPEGDEQE